MALTPAPMVWKILPKGVFSTRMANAICRLTPHSTTRSLISRLWAERSQATASMAIRPNSPVKRCILADDFQNQFAVFGPLRGNAEGVLDHVGGLFHMIFLGVIQPAETRARFHFLADLHFQNHAHRRIDIVLLARATRANHVGREADIGCVNDADVA